MIRDRRVLFLALAAAGATSLGAQAPYEQRHLPGLASFTAAGQSVPAAADIDDDGDVDLVIGTRAGTITLLENDGCATAPSFREVPPDAHAFGSILVGQGAVPALVDLDGDEDLDLVVGNWMALDYFRNDGSAASPVFVAVTGPASPFDGMTFDFAPAPTFGDVDDDGLIDLTLGTYSGVIRYFKNTGSTATPVFTEQFDQDNPLSTISIPDPVKPYLVDLDGDDDLDLLIGMRFAGPAPYRNVGTAQAATFQTWPGLITLPTVDDLSAAAVADFDGDGLAEMVLGQENGPLRYFDNSGTLESPHFVQNFGLANPISGPRMIGNSSPTTLDWDGDGRLEIVVGHLFGDLMSLKLDTNGAYQVLMEASQDPLRVLFPLFGSPTPSTGDIDADGDTDVVVGGTFNGLVLLRNDGTPSAPSFSDVGPVIPGLSGLPYLADIDGDDDLDIALGQGDSVVLVRNDGTPQVPQFTVTSPGSDPFVGIQASENGLAVPALADWDGDGDLDLLLGSTLGPSLAYCNDGTAQAPVFVPVPDVDHPLAADRFLEGQRPTFADLDRDGDIDLLVGSSGGELSFFASRTNDIFRDGFECPDRWSTATP